MGINSSRINIQNNGGQILGPTYIPNLTGSLYGTASNALSASYVDGVISSASYAVLAETASYVDITGSGVFVNYFGSQIQLTASTSDTASYALTASYVELAQTASYAISSSHAIFADTASNVESSSYALNASTASYINIVGLGITVNTGSFGVQLTASSTQNLQQTTEVGRSTSIGIDIWNGIDNPNLSGSHTFTQGTGVYARQIFGFAHGLQTVASGQYGFTQGNLTEAYGDASHAEGWATLASGSYSHAEGYQTTADFTSSHAEGWGTVAAANYQHAEGHWNVVDSNAIWILGDGASNVSRHNLIAASTGRVVISGSLVIDGGITGSIESAVSASHATMADTASLADTASWALNAVSSSYALSASYALTTDTASVAISSSHAVTTDTASYYLETQTLQDVTTLGNTTTASVFINTLDTGIGYSINTSFQPDVTSIVGTFGPYSTSIKLTPDDINLGGAGNGSKIEILADVVDVKNIWATGSITNAETASTAINAQTASYLNNLTQSVNLLGDLNVNGDIYVNTLHTIYETASVIYSTGSNIFGDNFDDIQQFTGSVRVNGNLESPSITGSLLGTSSYAIYAETASYVVSSSYSITASYAVSTSYAYSASYATSSSYSDTSSVAISASYALSSSYALSASYAVSSSLAQTASVALSLSSSVYAKEIHVSSGSGDDTLGNGTLLKPYKTITKACTVVDGTGQTIVIHPGTYTESPTLSAANVSVTSIMAAKGGDLAWINGTFTISATVSSTRLAGLKIDTLVHSGASNLYATACTVTTYNKTGNSTYNEFVNCAMDGSGISITGTGTQVFQGGKQALLTVNNASAVVAVQESIACTSITLTAGTLGVVKSTVYSTSTGTNAITAAAGTVASLQNTQILSPAGTAERIAMSGFLGYDDLIFDKTNSTVGTSLATKAHFQSVDVLTLTATGSLFGTASWSVSSSRATTASYAQTASFVLSSSYATTASYVILAQTASYVATASTAINAQTASYVVNALTASYVENAQTASYVVLAQTASYVLNAVSSSYALSGSYTINADTASTAVSSSYSTTSITSSYFVMSDYLVRNFADDTAAAAGGVPLGGAYRSGNFMLIRIV